MSLTKQQMVGAVGGGVFALGVIALGVMFYLAWSAKSEAEEQLNDESSAFQRFNSAPVYPSKQSIDTVKSNETNYAAWRTTATTLAAQGDRAFASETPAIFKQRLQAEARLMHALPGSVEGKIAAATFHFGFDQYLGESGELPKDTDVPRLAIQLDTITQLINLFADAGVTEIKNVQRIEPPRAEQKAQENEKASAKKPSRVKSATTKAREEAEQAKMTKMSYAFTVVGRPSSLVTILNQLAATPRFATVRDLAFGQATDVITERISSVATANAQKSTTSTRKRGRRAAAAKAEQEKEAAANQVSDVFDPEVDAAIQISFTLDVFDFGRGAVTAPSKVKSVEVAAEEPTKATDEKADAAKVEKPAEKQSAAPAVKEEKKEVGNEFLQ